MDVDDYLVSSSGQMSVPARVRRRWGLEQGGRITIVDLGDAVVLLPPGATERILGDALGAEDHRRFVAGLDDPDLGPNLRAAAAHDGVPFHIL